MQSVVRNRLCVVVWCVVGWVSSVSVQSVGEGRLVRSRLFAAGWSEGRLVCSRLCVVDWRAVGWCVVVCVWSVGVQSVGV